MNMCDIMTVTVNYKMKGKILAMLRSLFRDIHGTSLRVQPVIVDNASGDGMGDALRTEFGDRVIYIDAGANVGFGRGNNLALKSFESKYYFIANPDLVFLESQPHTVERLYRFMEEHPKVGIVAPRLMLPNGAIQPSCMRFPKFLDQPACRLGLHEKYEWARKRVSSVYMKDFDHARTQPIDWATGAALFVRGAWAKEVGFFDERYFMYFEDTDFCRTFWSRGWPVYYKGDVVIQHGHERASARVPGLKSVLLNPLTRIHIASLMKYAWKWRGQTL